MIYFTYSTFKNTNTYKYDNLFSFIAINILGAYVLTERLLRHLCQLSLCCEFTYMTSNILQCSLISSQFPSLSIPAKNWRFSRRRLSIFKKKRQWNRVNLFDDNCPVYKTFFRFYSVKNSLVTSKKHWTFLPFVWTFLPSSRFLRKQNLFHKSWKILCSLSFKL